LGVAPRFARRYAQREADLCQEEVNDGREPLSKDNWLARDG